MSTQVETAFIMNHHRTYHDDDVTYIRLCKYITHIHQAVMAETQYNWDPTYKMLITSVAI